MQLMHVMFGPLHALARQHALAVIVHLQHVELRLRLRPAEDDLKHMRDVVHQVHRVVPANHQEARLQFALWIGLVFFANIRQRRRFNRLSHAGKIFENGPVFNSDQAESNGGLASPRLSLLSADSPATLAA